MNERDKKLAEQCVSDRPYNDSFDWQKFANLVRADEREACAKQATELSEIGYDGRAIAIAIRAKGEVK